MSREGGRGGRLSLGELIDLELQLRCDRSLTRTQLAERDGRIGQEIDAIKLPDAALYRRWLERVRPAAQRSVGQAAQQALEMMSTFCAVAGFCIGAALVWGWLAIESSKPVNVIHFWTVTVGVQLFLLILLITLVLLPMAWWGRLPGMTAVIMLGRAVSRLIPAAALWLVGRLWPHQREALNQVSGELKALGRTYLGLRLLLSVRLTQVFAIAFNIGALGALVLAAYLTDPGFGWRSTLLEPPQVHALAETIASPWSGQFPAAAPMLEQVEHTQYTMLAERWVPTIMPETDDEPLDMTAARWAVWWPFLVASLAFYGLGLRIAVWLIVALMGRMALFRAMRRHAGFAQLRQRLCRPSIDTGDKVPDRQPEVRFASPAGLATHSHLGVGAYHILIWAGVRIEDHELQHWLEREMQSQVLSVQTVGQTDPALDARALEAIARGDDDAPILLLVQAWEPPVGDYLDFMAEARRILGERRMIHVVLVQRGPRGYLTSPRPTDMRTWQSRIASVGDPWLTVQPLVEGAGV